MGRTQIALNDAGTLAQRLLSASPDPERSAAGQLLRVEEPQAAALFALQDAVHEGWLSADLRSAAKSLLDDGGFGKCSFAAGELLSA